MNVFDQNFALSRLYLRNFGQICIQELVVTLIGIFIDDLLLNKNKNFGYLRIKRRELWYKIWMAFITIRS